MKRTLKFEIIFKNSKNYKIHINNLFIKYEIFKKVLITLDFENK